LTDTTPDAIIPLSKKLEALITLRDGQVGLTASSSVTYNTPLRQDKKTRGGWA